MNETVTFGQFPQFGPQQEYYTSPGARGMLRMRQPGEDFDPFAAYSAAPQQSTPDPISFSPAPLPAAPVSTTPTPEVQNAMLPAWLPQMYRDRYARRVAAGQMPPVTTPYPASPLFGQFETVERMQPAQQMPPVRQS